MSVGLAAGARFPEAMVMANVAASIVVRRFGTSVTTTEEVKAAWEGLHIEQDPALRKTTP